MNNCDQSGERVEAWLENQDSPGPPPEISVVVPAFNEEWRLPPTLIDIIDFLDTRGSPYEILVVDDGSSDATVDVVQKFVRIRPQVRLIRLPRNYGKGHAVRTGVLNARGKRVLFTDADGASPIAELPRLEAAMDEGADLAIGSRAVASPETAVTTRWYRKYLGRSFNLCVNLVLLPGIADTQCGFKLFTADNARYLFERQQADGFSFDVELLYMAQRSELKIAEIPINWTNIPGSKVNLVLDALRMFRDIMVFRVRHRNVSRAAYEEFLANR